MRRHGDPPEKTTDGCCTRDPFFLDVRKDMPKIVFDRNERSGDDSSIVTETETGYRGDKRQEDDKESELIDQH